MFFLIILQIVVLFQIELDFKMMYPGTENNLIFNFDEFVNQTAIKLVQDNGTELYSKNLLKELVAKQKELSQGKKNEIYTVLQ